LGIFSATAPPCAGPRRCCGDATSYLDFLEHLARRYRRQEAILIQDNASYHRDADVWAWFKSNRHWLEVHQLPPYSPELNSTERLWQHTRKNGTHNRFFGCVDALLATLTRVFSEMQSHPELIRSYLTPFSYARMYSYFADTALGCCLLSQQRSRQSGDWLIAANLANSGYAAAEVPVTVRTEATSVTQRIRILARGKVRAVHPHPGPTH
jgi:transposase